MTTTSVVRQVLKEPDIKPPAVAPETKIPAAATSNKSKGKRAVEVREEEEEPDESDDDDSDEELEALKQKLKEKKRLKRKKTGALDEQPTDSTRKALKAQSLCAGERRRRRVALEGDAGEGEALAGAAGDGAPAATHPRHGDG